MGERYLRYDEVMDQFSRSLATHEEHFFSLRLDSPEDAPSYLRHSTDQLHRLWDRMRRLGVVEK